MSEQDTYWFHCGSCGQLYQAEVAGVPLRTCPICGENPAPEPSGRAALAVDGSAASELVTLAHPPLMRARGSRRVLLIWKVIFVWLLFISLIYLAGKVFWQGEAGQGGSREQEPVADAPEVGPGGAEDQELLGLALPDCRRVLEAFFSTDRLAARLTLVRSHPTIAERMTQYYRDNPPLVVDPEGLELKKSTIFHLADGEAVILTLWESRDGALFDVAFRLDGGNWVIDWEHFVRYSEVAWPLFLAGSGEDNVAVFRLLARERLLGEDDPEGGIGVVLSAPIRRYLHEPGYQAPMMGIAPEDPAAQRLRAAFNMAKRHNPVFGAGYLDINPQDMIRVRVKVERISDDGGYKYRILEMLGCHWYSTDDTGVVFDEDPTGGTEGSGEDDVPEIDIQK